MSFDFQVRRKCDHKIIDERIYLESDRRSLRLLKPISSSTELILKINGSKVPKDHPEFGYSLIYKLLTSSNISGYSDKLDQVEFIKMKGLTYDEQQLLLNNSSLEAVSDLQSLYSSKGIYLQHPLITQSSIELINIQNNDFKYSNDNFIFIKTASDETVIFKRYDSNISDDIVLACKYEYIITFLDIFSGKVPYIKFNIPQKHLDVVYTVTYITDLYSCPKCLSYDYISDISFDSLGSVIKVSDSQKLLQDCYIFTFTPKGSDPFYALIGSDIFKKIGKKYINGVTDTDIILSVSDSLSILKNLQKQQKSIQDLTEDEILLNIESIKLEETSDLTVFNLSVVVESLFNKQLELSDLMRFHRVI